MTTNAYQTLQQYLNRGRARLAPSAISMHPDGPAAHDDVWLPTLNTGSSIRLHNTTTGHFVDVAPADVIDVEPDAHAVENGLVHMRVTLRNRLGLRGWEACWLDSRVAGWRLPVTRRTT